MLKPPKNLGTSSVEFLKPHACSLVYCSTYQTSAKVDDSAKWSRVTDYKILTSTNLLHRNKNEMFKSNAHLIGITVVY